MKLTGDIRCDFEKVTSENVKLKDRILGYQETISCLWHSLNAAQKSKDRQRADYEELLAQKDAVIKELELRHTVPLCDRVASKRKMPVWEHGPGNGIVIDGYCKCSGQ